MLKRLVLLLITLFLAISSVSFADNSANLLTNPGFEDVDSDGIPVGWYTDAYLLRDGVSQFSLSDTARTGQRGIMIENFDMNDARYAQDVKVEPNSIYRLSGWTLADDILDAGHGANLSIEGVYVFSNSVYGTTGDWIFLELYGRTGKDQETITVFARIGGYSGESQGVAYFDDLVLEKVDEVPADVIPAAWYTTQTVAAVEDPASDSSAASPAWPWLLVIATFYLAAALWIMRHLQLDEHDLQSENSPVKGRTMPAFAIVGIAIAALLRIVIALNIEGYQVDVNCFTAWGNTMTSVGPSMFYQSTWCDYTPGYIYVLGLNGWGAKLLGGVFSAAFVHKLIPMACDLIASLLIYRLARSNGYTRRLGGMLAVLFAFNPATILNSAAWCQIDSVLCILLMLVAYFTLHHKWALVLPLYVLAILVKPQALILGFLGLAAIILELQQHPIRKGVLQRCHKDMLLGLGLSLVVTLLIIAPFCPNQESPWWLIEKYKETLSSYAHATVNTANLYYLFGGNWDGIANPAATGACIFFAVLAVLWAAYTAIRQKRRILWWFEPVIMGIYAVFYLVLAIAGCSWSVLGTAAMSMAFAVVLPIFIRSGKFEHLPLCGAVLFIFLYVFGIKMHERYLFPAIFLLGMAYALRRDRRILALLIGTSCVLFVNEGIVLDNSIRLGSAMGHLNNDTITLANCLSVLNVAFGLVSIWTCHRVCVEDAPIRLSSTLGTPIFSAPKYENPPCTPLNFKPDAKLSINKRDILLMLIVTLVYAVVTLTTLGSTKAPQTSWKSTSAEERVYIDLGQQYEDFSMLYFAQPSYQNFAVEVRNDINFAVSLSDADPHEGWSEEYPAQMNEGMCYSWQYLNPSYTSNGKETFVNASDFSSVQKLTGRYVCINPRQAGLILNEIIFKDVQGNIIPNVTIIAHENGNERSPNFSDPANLLDEQDTLEGEPSWWNSTYFDEIYHARTAYELLHNQNVYEWTHPPLGKIIMSWFIAIFGMTPFGWRFAGAMCGILMLPAMYLLVKQLTKRTNMAFLGMMLMTLDCMHFTQTRLATIDSYPVLFIILSYFFMLRFMQRDIVLTDVRKLLPDLALSGFFMGCGFASKWIGAYAGVGLAVLFFWTCLRHIRMGRRAASMLKEDAPFTAEEREVLEKRQQMAVKRIMVLCLWCLLFFVLIPVVIYLLAYADRFADRNVGGFVSFIKLIIQETKGMLSYHGTPGLGMDHAFYSPWYEWPLMMTPMYYASAAFKPEGMTYAIFCFGNPWVWLAGLAGIAYTVYRWAMGHRYLLQGSESTLQIFRSDWDLTPAFVLIGLLAQFLPWVLVPRGTYIYHYFASVPFLILGVVLMLHHMTLSRPQLGKVLCIVYLTLCLVWFILLFPYASGMTTSNEWMDLIRDYPYISLIPNYWQSEFLTQLNSFLEKIPIFPHVYHH